MTEADDATRRTRLANERTFLAWLRSGLAAFAVAIAVGAVLPELTDRSRWPYAAAGVGFAALGVGLVVYGLVRERAVEKAIDRGGFAPVDRRALAALAVLAVVLGVAAAALIVLL
jgi:putative membrane protein